MISLNDILAGRGLVAAILSAVLLTVFAFSVTLVPIRADNDCWWHVKSGKIIAEDGLPTHDVFSYTAADHEWHNHEWLTQWAMWKIWSAGERTALGGWRAVILAKAITLWIGYLLLWFIAGRLSRNWWLALLIAAAALGIGRRTFYPRPPVVSNVMLAIELLILTGVHEQWFRRAWIWALVPLFALWTNLHGAWMAGAVVLVAYMAQDTFAVLRPRVPFILPFDDAPAPLPIKWWLGLGAATFLATLANPSGYLLYLLPGRVMSDQQLVASLGELQPPKWGFVYDFVLAAIATLVVVNVFLFKKKRAALRFAEMAIFAFFLWQAINHVRHLLLFGVLMVPLAARVWSEVAEGLKRFFAKGFPDSAAQRAGAVVLLLSAMWMLMVLRNWPEGMSYPQRNAEYLRIEEGYYRQAFPAALCNFVELVEFDGPMYNENHYAGYLIWRLSPEKHRVFSDSRFDIFGGTIWRQEKLVAVGYEPEDPNGELAWHDVLSQWNVNWAIVQPESGLAERMIEHRDEWAKVADWSGSTQQLAGYQIWVRHTPENEELIARARRIFQATTGVRLKD